MLHISCKQEWDRTRYISLLRNLHESQPAAMTAGLLANAYVSFARLARGTGWAHEVEASQWEEFGRWNQRGLELLSEFADEGVNDIVWMDALDSAQQTGSMTVEEYLIRRETMWRLDRGDLTNLTSAGGMLLPRWHGDGPEDVELFARRARDVTYDDFGESGYALGHAHFLTYGELEPSDTLVDGGSNCTGVPRSDSSISWGNYAQSGCRHSFLAPRLD